VPNARFVAEIKQVAWTVAVTWNVVVAVAAKDELIGAIAANTDNRMKPTKSKPLHRMWSI